MKGRTLRVRPFAFSFATILSSNRIDNYIHRLGMREMLRVMRQVNSSSSLVRTIPVFSNDQLRSDAMVSVLGESMSKPAHVLPMSVASLSSQIFKLTSLSLGLGRWISEGLALLGEAAVFRTSSWAVSPRNPQDNLLDGRSYGRTVLDLGIFKILHGLLPAQNILLRNGVQATGMLAAEEVAYAVMPDPVRGDDRSIVSRFAQAFATSLEMEAGLGLAGLASGHRLEMLRKSVEYNATVIAQGGRFRTWDRSSSEHEILSMHSHYRAGRRNEITNPSALHRRLIELEEFKVRVCNETDATEIWKIFIQLKELALKPPGEASNERELVRYAAVRVLLWTNKAYTQAGGGGRLLESALADSDFRKSNAHKYLDYEQSHDPFRKPGPSTQALRDYLNIKPWEELSETELDLSIVQSPDHDILIRLSELERAGRTLVRLDRPHEYWRRLVQLRDVALNPHGHNLETQERMRYMAVSCLLKAMNVAQDQIKSSDFDFELRSFLLNLALRNDLASRYLESEIETDSNYARWKDWIVNRESVIGGEIFFRSMFTIMGATVLVWGVAAMQGYKNGQCLTDALMASSAIFGGGLAASPVLAELLRGMILNIRERYHRFKFSGSVSTTQLRDYIHAEPWRSVEVPLPTLVRARPDPVIEGESETLSAAESRSEGDQEGRER